MRKSLVSLVALGLFIGAPALMDTAAAGSNTDTKASQSDTSGTTAQTDQTGQTGTTTEELAAERSSEILDSDRINQMFGEAQFEGSTDIEGRVARAMTSQGHDVLVFVGPEDMGTGDRVELEDSDFRDRFQEGGFTGLQVFEQPHIVRADLDEDHYIFVLAADELSRMPGQMTGMRDSETDTQTGTTAGQTDLETDTETGTAMGETDTQTDLDTESETAMGEMDTQTETELDTETGTAMGETESELDTESETAMGETDTQTETEFGTESETAMGETDTQTETELGTESETAMGETETEQEGQIGRGISEPASDDIIKGAEDAGLEDAAEFSGRLARASTEDGQSVYLLITTKDMQAKGELDIEESDVRQKLQDAGFQDIQFMDDAQIVRGSLEGDNVFVFAGRGLMGGTATQQ